MARLNPLPQAAEATRHSLPPEKQPFAQELKAECTRLLYQSARLPTWIMMLAGLLCTALLWQHNSSSALLIWFSWLCLLAILRLVQLTKFSNALPSEQAKPYWRRNFLLGSGALGGTMSVLVLYLIPSNALLLQTLVFSLISAAILSATISYAVSRSAFLAFSIPCLLPSTIFLLTSDHSLQRGWGVLSLMMLVSMPLIAWQVNRLVIGSLLGRFENQNLLNNIAEAKRRADGLNQELAREIEQRRRAERDLREAHDQLTLRVDERTRERDATSQELNQSETRLNLALEASDLGLWDWDVSSDSLHHTQVFELFGLEPKNVKNMLRDLRPRVHPADAPILRQAMIAHFKGETDGYALEYRVRHANGNYVWLEDRGRAVARDSSGRVLRMLGTRRNITAVKAGEHEQRLAATVFEAATEGIIILDPEYKFVSANNAFCRISGYSLEELVHMPVHSFIHTEHTREQFKLINKAMQQTHQWSGELVEQRRNGEVYPALVQLKMVHDNLGNVSHIVCFLADLSVRRQAEERMRYLAHYDELTGLANRVLFKERLHDAAQRARHSRRSLALLHIDLDRFKLLNDSLGHEVADQLLQQVARRLSQSISDAETIARVSGDEFAIILDAYTDLSSLARLSEKLLSQLRQPLEIAGHELMISASIGISLMPENARELQTLINQANMAMKHAKHLGGNTFQFFTDNLQSATLERLQLETQLRKGINEGQLEVYYQPKVCLHADHIRSAEALVRWNHPQLGLVAPGQFIELAEETGLIAPIGEFVLRQACRQARQWQLEGLANLQVSVNISGHQLRQGNLCALVEQVLEETELDPQLLELELTESLLLDNIDNVLESLHQLDALGISMSIDDFGTGFSSLSYLKRLPVKCVKIDQSFVRELPENPNDAAITRAILALAHSLDLKVVAEGVETQAQMDFLKEQHCDAIQGYLISRPVPAAAFANLLRAQQD